MPSPLPEDFMAKFDRGSLPIDDEQWASLQGERDYRFVLITRIGDIATVITIWDGYDPYRMTGVTPHLIFETCVFRPSTEPKGVRLEANEDLRWTSDEKIEVLRHATEAEARAWHHNIAEQIQKNERS